MRGTPVVTPNAPLNPSVKNTHTLHQTVVGVAEASVYQVSGHAIYQSNVLFHTIEMLSLIVVVKYVLNTV